MISILDLITIIGFIWGVFSVGFTLGRALEKTNPCPKKLTTSKRSKAIQ